MAKGEAFEVVVGITYPTDPDVIKRILSGAHVPTHERKAKRAEPGEIVDDIPECSQKWLLEQGQIRRSSREPASASAPEPAAAQPEPVAKPAGKKG